MAWVTCMHAFFILLYICMCTYIIACVCGWCIVYIDASQLSKAFRSPVFSQMFNPQVFTLDVRGEIDILPTFRLDLFTLFIIDVKRNIMSLLKYLNNLTYCTYFKCLFNVLFCFVLQKHAEEKIDFIAMI